MKEKEALEALNVGTVIDAKKVIAHILVNEVSSCRI